MPTTITNQATLQYTYGATTATAASNIATTVLQDPFSVLKSTLESAYRANGELTYLVTLTNSSATTLSDVTVTDDLGTYAVSPTLSVTPLFYTGPAQLYINGVFQFELVPEPGINSIVFTIASIPAGATAMLLYQATVSDEAPQATGASITNTVTVAASGVTGAITASHTIPAETYADVSIVKTMSPNPVSDGATLTYTFTAYNYGNTAATNVILSDTFSPAPVLTASSVSINGVTVSSADYTYTDGVLTLPSAGASIALTVPAATFTQDATTGAISTSPGTTVITVTGTI